MTAYQWFQMTQEHVDGGQRSDPFFCPVASCLRQNGYPHVSVGRTSWRPTVKHREGRSRGRSRGLPKYVTNWIERFDAKKPVKPLRFRLKVPR
jgi:hypothetical protein